MKRLNLKKTILEKGGLMIEALAMLGLIAVVTPTMYKKSAERTMEVDDINTASTIRTIMNAADSYVASNYTALLDAIPDGTTYTVANSNLASFLPYGFDIDKALYNYGTPTVGLRRDENNLTAFVLFPAKGDEETGLGRERTARIAALVGSNGGYVAEENKARGVGGIWKLEGGDFTSIFSGNPNVNSIVTASSEAISSSVLSELDNPKYLQRGIDEGDGAEAKWKNTMRTDLYMGGYMNDEDIYPGDEMRSIRNIKSLIVGAEYAGAGAADDGNYGLYIDSTDAYVGGSLAAAGGQFLVDTENLIFGEAGEGVRKFSVSKTGNVQAEGTLTNFGNINLASKPDKWNDISIGALAGGANYVIKANHDNISLLNPDTVNISNDKIKLMGDAGSPVKYNAAPTFPVEIGSNVLVGGILAAEQIDTNKIRTASIEVGSANVDDARKWMTVDENGVKINDPNVSMGNQLLVNSDLIALRVVDSSPANPAQITLSKDEGGKILTQADNIETHATTINTMANSYDLNLYTADDGTSGSARMYNSDVEFGLHKSQIYLGKNKETPGVETRTIIESDHVDLVDANFRVMQDGSDTPVLSVRGNNRRENGSWDGTNYNDNLTHPASGDTFYDIAVHGSMIVTDRDGAYTHLATGHQNSNAAVNIVTDDNATNNNDPETVLYVNQRATGTANDYNDVGPGTIYMRKGMLSIKPNNDSTKTDIENSVGTIQASRFVANNVDGNGLVTVPQLVTSDAYRSYNGVTTENRYDTYMVNPAYTSVMHDIKLTTRGGARLSDILPDFINKGIYIVNNTYPDTITNMVFTGTSSGKIGVKEVEGDGGVDPLPGGSDNMILGSVGSWASPYLGAVPAPQCPPGYVRLITLTPVSMMMAQSGIPYKNDTGVIQKYYIMPNNSNDQASLADKYVSPDAEGVPGFREVNMTTVSGAQISLKDPNSGNIMTYDLTNMDNIKTAETVFAGGIEGQSPLMFQQSTWLKSHVIPLVAGKPMGIGSTPESKDYVLGWAAVMGFLYPEAYYKGFIKEGNDDKLVYSGTAGSRVYWNVFPVIRKSLEGHATTYCYFDRNNLFGMYNNNAPTYIDVYNAIMTPDRNYKKTEGGTFGSGTSGNNGGGYLNRLNDPALQYNEVW